MRNRNSIIISGSLFCAVLALAEVPDIFMPHEDLDPTNYESLFEEMAKESNIPQKEEEISLENEEPCYPYLERGQEESCGK